MVSGKMNNERGSFTVEAALVFSTVFFCLLALIYMSLLLYQQVRLQSVASMAAQRGALVWSNPARDMYITRLTQQNLAGGDLYWRIIDTRQDEKKNKISAFIKTQAGSRNALNSVNGEIQPPSLEDYIIYKKLEVTVSKSYKIPVGNLLKAFGLSDEFRLTATDSAVINEPAEFIRNTDFLIDTGKEIDRKLKLNLAEKGAGILDTVKKALEKLKTYFFKE